MPLLRLESLYKNNRAAVGKSGGPACLPRARLRYA